MMLGLFAIFLPMSLVFWCIVMDDFCLVSGLSRISGFSGVLVLVMDRSCFVALICLPFAIRLLVPCEGQCLVSVCCVTDSS